jgi:hypothetical protein
VESDQRGDVDVGDAIAIGEAESFIVLQIGGDAPSTGRPSSWSRRYRPASSSMARRTSGELHAVIGRRSSVTSAVWQEVVREILLDHIAFVSQADDELIDPVRGKSS